MCVNAEPKPSPVCVLSAIGQVAALPGNSGKCPPPRWTSILSPLSMSARQRSRFRRRVRGRNRLLDISFYDGRKPFRRLDRRIVADVVE